MKKICIFGFGGFALEVFWLAQACGYIVDAFIDLIPQDKSYHEVKIATEEYFNPNCHLAVLAIGSSQLRYQITQKLLKKYSEEIFVTLIHPSAILMDPTISIGLGSVICANCILTCDISLGRFSQLNLATTVGHNTTTGECFTTAPSVNISGNLTIEERVYFGTASCAIEKLNICSDVTIGAGACVVKNIIEAGTYVGTPAKKLLK